MEFYANKNKFIVENTHKLIKNFKAKKNRREKQRPTSQEKYIEKNPIRNKNAKAKIEKKYVRVSSTLEFFQFSSGGLGRKY